MESTLKVTITTDTNPAHWGGEETDEDVCLRAAELLADECAAFVKFQWPQAEVQTVSRYHHDGETIRWAMVHNGNWELDHDIIGAVGALVEEISPDVLADAICEVDGEPA